MPNRGDFTRTLAAAALTGLARPAVAQSGLTTLHVGTNAADDVTPLLWAKATGMFSIRSLSKTRNSAIISAPVVEKANLPHNNWSRCNGSRPSSHILRPSRLSIGKMNRPV